MSRRTVTAIIATDVKTIGAYFAWSSATQLKSLLVDYTRCPKNTAMVGKWVEMTLDDRDRADGPVKILPDVFETRILSGVVEVRVKFQHDGRYKDQFEMYYNDYFGFICDPMFVISRAEPNAWYNGWIVRHKMEGVQTKWRLSSRQEHLAPIFNKIEQREFGNQNPETSDTDLQVVCALVHTRHKDNHTLYAWSKNRPRSTICMDYSFCSNGDYMGRWVEVSVDGRNRVQRPARILNDVFETRRNMRVEVLAEFRQISNSAQKSNNQDEMFYSDYFGCVRDDHFMVDNVKKDGWYKGWIEYDKLKGDETGPRWRICMNQTVVELSDRQNGLAVDQNRSITPSQARSRSRSPENRYRGSDPHYESRFRSLTPKASDSASTNNERTQPWQHDHTVYKDLGKMPERDSDNVKMYTEKSRQTETLAPSNQASSHSASKSSVPLSERDKQALRKLETTMSRVGDIFAFFNSSTALQNLMRQMDIEQYEEMLELAEIEE